jgi:uncharacterized protein YkwD
MGVKMVKRIMLIVLITIAFVAGVFLIKPLIINIISQSLNSLYISNNDNTSDIDRTGSEPVPVEFTPKSEPVVITVALKLEVLKLVNIERQNDGKKPLTYMNDLEKGANMRAIEVKELWSHTRPNGTLFFTAFEYLRYTKIGENLAAGPETPNEAVTGWMRSIGHRSNILDETYEQMAMSISEDDEGRLFWVQIFYRGK